MDNTQKKQLISDETLDIINKVEEKIIKGLESFSVKYNCSLNDVVIRIVGRDNDYPFYAVFNNETKLAIVKLDEIIKLNSMEKLFIKEKKIEENIYRNLTKILIGFNEDVKLSNFQILIKYNSDYNEYDKCYGKLLFNLYVNGKKHKSIQSDNII